MSPRFTLGERVWARGYISGIWYPAVITGLPRLTRLSSQGRCIKAAVFAYQIEIGGRAHGAEEEYLRPRDDTPPVSGMTDVEITA